jgi:hypothetical protein
MPCPLFRGGWGHSQGRENRASGGQSKLLHSTKGSYMRPLLGGFGRYRLVDLVLVVAHFIREREILFACLLHTSALSPSAEESCQCANDDYCRRKRDEEPRSPALGSRSMCRGDFCVCAGSRRGRTGGRSRRYGVSSRLADRFRRRADSRRRLSCCCCCRRC